MSITCAQLLDTFPELLSYVSGNQEISIKDVQPAENGTAGGILFISNEKNFMKAIQSPASVLVVPESHKDKAKPFIGAKTLLSSKNPTLAMAKVIEKFFLPNTKQEGIHPTAIVHKSAKISKSAWIGPYVIVEENVVIGDHTQLQSHVVIERDTRIGSDCVIMPHVFIGYKTQIGNFCEIQPHSTIASEGYGYAHDNKGHHHRIAQRGIVVLEDYVSIGANCAIDRATFAETRIGLGTKFDNFVHIAHNCKIGQHCLFAGGVMISGSTVVGNHVVMGGQTAAVGHIQVCDNAQFGGRSGIMTDITEPGAYTGHPLEKLKDNLKTLVSIKRINTTVKDVRKILKHLGLESSAKADKGLS